MRPFLSLLLCLLAFPVDAQTRHALVVGIDDYAHVERLQKAVNDADAVEAALAVVGFQVTTLRDPDRRALNQGLANFTNALEPGDEALFYFAGHGIEVDGRNYLLPADIPAARPGDEDFLIGEAIGVDRILASMQRRGARVSLLILDACRDNPFPGEGTRSLGGRRGLARVEAPEGAFILFSAGFGQAALDRLSDDDPNPNSVFTRALLPRLTEPGLDIHNLAQAVRREVRALARQVNHNQFPAYYDQLSGNFSFNPQGAYGSPPPPVTPAAAGTAPRQAGPNCEAARRDWAMIEAMDSPMVIEAFLGQYADCPLMAAVARARLDEIRTDRAGTRLPPEPDRQATIPAGTQGIAHEIVRGARISSHWDHNGSRMGLIANGNARRFIYVVPRPGIARRGVQPGTLLFEGRRDGQHYIGTARIFARPPCGAFTYPVSGPIAPDDRGVTVHGRAPLVDENCQISGYRDDTLVFTLE